MQNMTIDKIMNSGGPDTKQMDMETFIKLADKEKIEADALNDLFKEIEDKFKDQGKPGETITEFIKRIDVSELKRIELKSGGKIINLSDIKDPIKAIRKIDLSSTFGPNTSVSSLSEKDKETVLMLLKMSGIGGKE